MRYILVCPHQVIVGPDHQSFKDKFYEVIDMEDLEGVYIDTEHNAMRFDGPLAPTILEITKPNKNHQKSSFSPDSSKKLAAG